MKFTLNRDLVIEHNGKQVKIPTGSIIKVIKENVEQHIIEFIISDNNENMSIIFDGQRASGWSFEDIDDGRSFRSKDLNINGNSITLWDFDERLHEGIPDWVTVFINEEGWSGKIIEKKLDGRTINSSDDIDPMEPPGTLYLKAVLECRTRSSPTTRPATSSGSKSLDFEKALANIKPVQK